MSEEDNSEQNRRRFIRIDVTEDVEVFDDAGHDIGKVEKVGAGGMQIRISPKSPQRTFTVNSEFPVTVVEPGNIRQRFNVKVRACDGDRLGVEFVT